MDSQILEQFLHYLLVTVGILTSSITLLKILNLYDAAADCLKKFWPFNGNSSSGQQRIKMTLGLDPAEKDMMEEMRRLEDCLVKFREVYSEDVAKNNAIYDWKIIVIIERVDQVTVVEPYDDVKFPSNLDRMPTVVLKQLEYYNNRTMINVSGNLVVETLRTCCNEKFAVIDADVGFKNFPKN